jgi:hypothetical protein
MPVFKVEDRVRWVRAVSSPEIKDALGIVTNVIPNDTGVDEFAMYDIKFLFRKFILYGTQIEPE